jgi:hypothetical protein
VEIRPTTIAGVMAVTAYFAEHMDRYPGCGWIGGEIAYDDPCWFGDGLIRNLAAALAKITATEKVSQCRNMISKKWCASSIECHLDEEDASLRLSGSTG